MEHFMSRLGIEDRTAYLHRWLDLGPNLDPSTIADFIKAGVTPQEAPFLAQWRDKQHLKEELRTRALELPPFDLFAATRINDSNSLGDYEWEHLDLFNREVLWDYHTEEEIRRTREEERRIRLEQGVHGEVLVAVVEQPYNASEEEAEEHLQRTKDAAIAAALNAGHDESRLRVKQRDTAFIAVAADGTAYAAVLRHLLPMPHVLGEPRPPTAAEVAEWAEPVTEATIEIGPLERPDGVL